MDVIEIADDDASDTARMDFLVESAAERTNWKKRGKSLVVYRVDEKPPVCIAAMLALQVYYYICVYYIYLDFGQFI